jgi:hypothetical protein
MITLECAIGFDACEVEKMEAKDAMFSNCLVEPSHMGTDQLIICNYSSIK